MLTLSVSRPLWVANKGQDFKHYFVVLEYSRFFFLKFFATVKYCLKFHLRALTRALNDCTSLFAHLLEGTHRHFHFRFVYFEVHVNTILLSPIFLTGSVCFIFCFLCRNSKIRNLRKCCLPQIICRVNGSDQVVCALCAADKTTVWKTWFSWLASQNLVKTSHDHLKNFRLGGTNTIRRMIQMNEEGCFTLIVTCQTCNEYFVYYYRQKKDSLFHGLFLI